MEETKYDFQMDAQAFSENSNKLFSDSFGKVVILHNGEIIKIFETIMEAYNFGVETYGLGMFTLKEILPESIKPIHFFSPYIIK